jgi:uncharacterized protein (DUF1015 family)
MAVIAPFRGLTYNISKMDDISKLITPPYDVISEKEQEEYYQSHPQNVIRMILGKKKTGDSDWDNRYTRAADYLNRWESDGILVRDHHPCIYLTSHTYDSGDGSGPRIRWGFIALVRIEDESSGVILPHEKTFSAHRDDRMKLMRACRAQLSQVFALYDDPDAGILEDLKKASINLPPYVSFDFKDDTSHSMWVIRDQALFKKVADTMIDKSIFIADGHHRYETSKNFRNIMRARHGRGKGNRSYEYIMMYLTDMNDEGLTILPSHRMIRTPREFRPDNFFAKARQWFEVEDFPFLQAGEVNVSRGIKEALEEKGLGKSAIGFYYHRGDRYYILSLKKGAKDEMAQDLLPPLRQLDTIVLSRLLLQKCLGLTKEDLDNEGIFHYNSNMEDSISLVNSGAYDMTFMLNPTRMDQVKEVAKNNLIMPRKSTFFYPKVLTGLVFNKIDPHETVELP